MGYLFPTLPITLVAEIGNDLKFINHLSLLKLFLKDEIFFQKDKSQQLMIDYRIQKQILWNFYGEI